MAASTRASLSGAEHGRMKISLRPADRGLNLVEPWPFVNEKRPSRSSRSAFQSGMSPRLVPSNVLSKMVPWVSRLGNAVYTVHLSNSHSTLISERL